MKKIALTDKIAFIGDVHIPFQDKKCISIVYKFLEIFQPTFIYLIGDLLDVYAFSRYDKDPDLVTSFRKEINQGKEFLEIIRQICPHAEIHWLDGNHEDRILRYIYKNPELKGLPEFSLENMLSLPDYDISYHPYKEILEHGSFLVEHGDVVRGNSAYSARGHLDKRLMSGISGHTHRMGSHFKTAHKTQLVWYENGCLCGNKPEYIRGVPNWQQGFSIGRYDRQTDKMWIQQLPIVDHQLFYQDWLITP